ncbi:unnamed protein product [Didymodactylos carnosus]|uniref:K Homology domain-containing protein n=1 Tax=Didymodactylos carnosus TaxID=1234261 RepID=A0A814FIE9_9BILA|nr:unnamed protein product [Didymodactylos carnosus]CAF0985441.1 unnamed protein product [Didymodactylos carnosus]CAF3604586.1 unnamed protein product [Didymodactylos carnosus]CAF3757701.1 unnamed protein product [Didymodactylos carnosus]
MAMSRPPNDYPLRILVPSECVGAIIGKGGAQIKQIKQQTHAKVDVNKTESASNSTHSQERVIIIRGQQDNCVEACHEILKIMYDDAQIKNRSTEVVLKVLAHNNYIGRIIGKAGNIINNIKKESDCTVTVSSVNDVTPYNCERIITIKGELDNEIKALETVYSKLCMAHENDYTKAWTNGISGQPQLMMIGPPQHSSSNIVLQSAQLPPPASSTLSHPQQILPTNFSNTMVPKLNHQPNFSNPYYPSPFYPTPGGYYMVPTTNLNSNSGTYNNMANSNYSRMSNPVANETVNLYVPNTVVGAIIGTKGLFIKSIIKHSNASVKIAPISPDEDQNKIIDRQVTIIGTPEAQWKAQYYIYDKIRQEGYAGNDDVKLRAEVFIPSSVIGRLIGKGGQNVRELQRQTGAAIKLPDDSQQQTQSNEVPVKIIGPFQASQFAQRRIQSLIQMSMNRSEPSSSTLPNINDNSSDNRASHTNNNDNTDDNNSSPSASESTEQLTSSMNGITLENNLNADDETEENNNGTSTS